MTPTKEKAFELMKLAMPPFAQFLEHGNALKGECEKAGELTPERAALFQQYANALEAGRASYEDEIAKFICEQATAEEVDTLIAFFASPAHRVVEKFLTLGTTVNAIGTAWQTKVLESCPDTWQMIVEQVGLWQEKNTPETCEVTIPESPDAMRAAIEERKQAEEFDTSDAKAESVPFTP